MTSKSKYTPGRALAELKAQHDALRDIMEGCEILANAVEAGRTDPLDLTREVTRLRLAFEAHNRFEEELLKPVLMSSDAFAGVRIDRMVEDHIGEHRQMRTRLESSELGELRDAIETLRAHLEAEERYLLTSRVLHDTSETAAR